MKFAPKHVVAMAVSLSAAVVLAPVGVMAATGQLVNITDPYYPERRARVTTSNSLQAETRAGSGPNSFSAYREVYQSLGTLKLADAIGPDRLAVTEVSAGSHGPVSGATYGHNYVDVVSYVQTTGTAACGTTSTGYTVTVLRRLVLRNQMPSVQQTFEGPALLAPAPPAGKRACVVLKISLISTETTVFMGGTGYRIDG